MTHPTARYCSLSKFALIVQLSSSSMGLAMTELDRLLANLFLTSGAKQETQEGLGPVAVLLRGAMLLLSLVSMIHFKPYDSTQHMHLLNILIMY